jgi:hypothetical protein
MSIVVCAVTPGKVFVPDGDGKYIILPSALNQLGIPSVQVDLTGGVAAVDLAAGAVTAPKYAEMTVDGLQAPRIARATYNFAVNGGTVGAKGLGVSLPDNAVITRSWWEVITPFTSGAAAEIALHAETANDIATAAVLGTHGTAGFHEGFSTGTAANFKKTTGVRELTLTISVADLTAGKLILFCEYVVTE